MRKKIDPSGEESGHTASQVPQKLVHANITNLESKPIGKEFDKSVKQGSGSQIKVDSGINLEDKSSVPLLSNNLSLNLIISDSGSGNVNICTKNDDMLMGAGIPMPEKVSNRQIDEVGTPEDQTNTGKGQPTKDVIKESVLAPKSPPPPPVLGAQTNTSASVPPPPLSPPPVPNKSGEESGHTASQVPQENSVNQDKLNVTLSNDGDKGEMYDKRVEGLQAERKKRLPTGYLSMMDRVMADIRKGVKLKELSSQTSSEEKSGHTASQVPQENSVIDASSSSDSSGRSSNVDKEQDKQSFAPAQAGAPIGATYEIDSDNELVNLQPDNEKRSKSPDSAYGSKSPSPLDFKSETEKPQVPASLQEELSVTKVNNVDPVNSEIQDPSALSAKEHTKHLNS